jgi:hypothetical protein
MVEVMCLYDLSRSSTTRLLDCITWFHEPDLRVKEVTEVKIIEWWYDDASYHAAMEQEICLARLVHRDDMMLELLLETGEMHEFSSRDEALLWLGDEEYRRLDDLIQDYIEEGRQVPPQLSSPEILSEGALLRQMRVILTNTGREI